MTHSVFAVVSHLSKSAQWVKLRVAGRLKKTTSYRGTGTVWCGVPYVHTRT